MDRGELGVYVARVTGRGGLARLLLRALVGRLDHARDFESMRVTELEIEATRPTVRIACDGEVSRMRSPLRFRIRPRALAVAVPSASA
jgi:diacylglycerol kinase family enzyme